MSEVLVCLVFFYGIALGLWLGWIAWRIPHLNYDEQDD